MRGWRSPAWTPSELTAAGAFLILVLFILLEHQILTLFQVRYACGLGCFCLHQQWALRIAQTNTLNVLTFPLLSFDTIVIVAWAMLH